MVLVLVVVVLVVVVVVGVGVGGLTSEWLLGPPAVLISRYRTEGASGPIRRVNPMVE